MFLVLIFDRGRFAPLPLRDTVRSEIEPATSQFATQRHHVPRMFKWLRRIGRVCHRVESLRKPEQRDHDGATASTEHIAVEFQEWPFERPSLKIIAFAVIALKHRTSSTVPIHTTLINQDPFLFNSPATRVHQFAESTTLSAMMKSVDIHIYYNR